MTRLSLASFLLCCLVGMFVLSPPAVVADQQDPHLEAFLDDPFPSATVCADCHQRIFQEWASSNHAYASISPMFHKFEQRVNELTSGTMGTFCVRCHQQVGTQEGEPREMPLWERSAVSREGVTCVTCHRVKHEFGKVDGERHLEPGPITDPIYGSGIGDNLQEVLENADRYNVRTEDNPEGRRETHDKVIEFEQISQSQFCVSCHQVAVNLGIKLEVVWDQYRGSPAEKEGITCQDCHMGKVPGRAEGYDTGHIAVVDGEPVGSPDVRHSNHAFYGPGYPIAHPGIFPINPRAYEWTIEEWLRFDYRSGWGEEQWERDLAAGRIDAVDFPEPWQDPQVRKRARVVVEQNKAAMDYKREHRRQVMENGSKIEGPFFRSEPRAGESLRFHYTVTSTNKGHNKPSGSLGAQPEIWLNVALIDPDGNNVWESGYVDSAGDMADLHSADVLEGRLEHDDQLFNLQTKFLTTNLKGTDREMYLPVNFDVDQLPFLRPDPRPTTVLNHPAFVRMEGRSIPPLGSRDAKYRIPGELLEEPGTYRLQVRMRSRAEPIYFMRFVGATEEMERAINEWMVDIHPYAVEFEVQ